jgi:hypothetical protein
MSNTHGTPICPLCPALQSASPSAGHQLSKAMSFAEFSGFLFAVVSPNRGLTFCEEGVQNQYNFYFY